MAGHSVSANLLMLILLIGGFVLSGNIKKEVFPDFELDLVTIGVAYPGAGPEEVEQGIILAIEEAIQGIEGIKEFTATAQEGFARIGIEIEEGEDVRQIAKEIEDEVNRISSFPEDAEEVHVTVAKRKRYVIALALFGNQPERVLREMADTIRDRLLRDPEISQVDLEGVRDYEISIEIPQTHLQAYHLTLDAVVKRLRRAAVELPGGAIKTVGGDVLVRVKERRDFAHEFATIPIITTPDGTQVRLEDIANISEGFEDTDRFATFNGQPAVMIRVYRVGDQTPISVSDAVLRKMAEIKHILPTGLSIQPRNDRSKVYRQRLDLMLRNGYIGLGLVFILLAIFLEARLAFWVSLGIPISFLGSLLILPAVGVSINMVSMFAFIVTLGIVVDDAIIVGENIYFQRQQGLNWFQAAIKGAHRMAMPVTFAIITNMVAFMPLFFVPGFMGKVFKHIPIVVICVFAVSLVESLFILPAHLGHQKEDGNGGGILSRLASLQRQFSRFFIRMVNTLYGPFLKWVLRWRYVTVSIGIAVLLVTIGYVKSGRMGFVLFPRIESDYAKVTAQTPFGTATEKTMAVQKQLVTAVQEIIEQNGGDQLSEGIYAFTDGNRVQVYANLTPPEKRPISTAQLTKLWRQQVNKNLPGLETIKFESDAGGPGRGASIAVELSHRNIPVLERASNEMAGALSQYPNVIDIDSGFSPGKQQIDFKIKPEGRSLGLESSDVARQIRHAYYGAEVLRQQRGRNEVRVIVRRPKSERISEYDLEEMTLRTPTGKDVALREVANLTRGRAYTSITRRDGRRVVTVTADSRPRKIAGQVMANIKADILPALQQKYPGLTFSFEGRQADRRESMQALKKGMLMALLIIYAILAIPFNSFLQPMIIMCSIPFGIVGAIIGHLLMGYSLSVISMFGVVALSGVVVNDSLVLIEFANRRHLSGIPVAAAIHQAALHRFRPILLTTLTTFGGLSPIIFETSRQARFLIPMAISLGYGILFATLITLILVPSLYLILDDIKKLAGKFWR